MRSTSNIILIFLVLTLLVGSCVLAQSSKVLTNQDVISATIAEQSTQQDCPIYSTFVESRVNAKIEKIDTEHAKVTPDAARSPGEYAIVLRPVDKSHKFSGEELGKNQPEVLLFNYARALSVKKKVMDSKEGFHDNVNPTCKHARWIVHTFDECAWFAPTGTNQT